MNHAALKVQIEELFPKASRDFLRLNSGLAVPLSAHPSPLPGAPGLVAAPVPDPEPQPDLREPLEGGDAVPSGGAGGVAPGLDRCRPRVLITLYRVRLLDTDNKWASVKPILDALRYAQVIPDDREKDIVLTVEQTKVNSYKLEGTGIVVEWPEA